MPRNIASKELHGWTLGSIAWEAKERLDKKFSDQRESVIKSPGTNKFCFMGTGEAAKEYVAGLAMVITGHSFDTIKDTSSRRN